MLLQKQKKMNNECIDNLHDTIIKHWIIKKQSSLQNSLGIVVLTNSICKTIKDQCFDIIRLATPRHLVLI